MPTENLPVKSHDVEKTERRVLVRKTDSEPCTSSAVSPTPEPKITDIEYLINLVEEVEIQPWEVDKSNASELKFELFDAIHYLLKYSIVVDSALFFSVHVYHWPIPDDHVIYQQRKRSVKYNNFIELLELFSSSNICQELTEDDDVKSVAVDATQSHTVSSTVVRHSIPKLLSSDKEHFEISLSYRCVTCDVILDNNDSTGTCKPCLKAAQAIKKSARRKTQSSSAPAKKKAPLAACGADKLRATVKAQRLECKQLEARLDQLQTEIKKDGVGVSEGLEKDILTIMGGQNLEATPHMKFFWEQQMKLLQTKKMGRRYHPQVIRFALSLHGKSPSAYRELRDSGALVLPSERILRDYKNYFKPKAGINDENVCSLKEKVSSFSGVQRYVVLVMDEMKIQSNLVFDKVTGELIGFVDLGDPMTNFANITDEDPVATHALAFLVRGLCTDMKHVIAYFFTGNVTSFQLMPLFWRIISVLELALNLWVCAAVNDGASPNRKFFRLHCQLASGTNSDVVYNTPNLYAMSRVIYFFADSPHLMKTAQNCLYNSGHGSSSRYMWNNGHYLLFRHIADLFYADQEFGLHGLPKLTLEHIALTSYSKMKVKLATQVLSKSVAVALRESGKEEVTGTAQFCEMMNSFFDITNVRSKTEHVRKRNEFIKPYRSADDERLVWLKDVFLAYLEDWQRSISNREGDYSADQQGRMFLSSQTYEGLKISSYSHMEIIPFLLGEGFEYVLTERFMQDVVEDYFGHQRGQGGRSDNPDAYQFGYNDLIIASQRDIAPVIRGNVGGRYEKTKWYKVSDEPVKKPRKDESK